MLVIRPMKNNNVLTTFQISQYCQVNISTVIHWVKTNKLPAYRTPGGHRRVSREDFIAFLKKYNLPVPSIFQEQVK